MKEFKWINSNEKLPEEQEKGILINVEEYCFVGTLWELGNGDSTYLWYCDANEEWDGIPVRDTHWSYIPNPKCKNQESIKN